VLGLVKPMRKRFYRHVRCYGDVLGGDVTVSTRFVERCEKLDDQANVAARSGSGLWRSEEDLAVSVGWVWRCVHR
jgi:hypothetical protein